MRPRPSHVPAALAVLVLLAAPALAGAGPDIKIGTTYTLESAKLKETRTLLVHTPPGYDAGTDRYPVLYLLDGEAHFAHTSAAVDFLAVQGRIPPLIVVAVTNTDRTRDFTPKGALKTERGEPMPLPTAGGADNFLAFLSGELVPWVDANFRTAPYRVFAGHSFGGLLALHTLFTKPDAFNAVLAVAPTFNWDEDYLVRAAKPFFAAGKEARRAVFVAIGDEPQLAPGFAALATLMKASKAEGFEGTAREYQADDHGSLVLLAHHDGLRALFAGWNPPVDRKTGFPAGTLTELKAHYDTLSRRVGYTVKPPERVVNLAGYGRLADKKVDEALALFELNTKNYPISANVWDSLGDGLEAAGRQDEARTAVAKAVELGEKNKDPLLAAFREHLQRFDAKASK